jgi:hypothetical protein
MVKGPRADESGKIPWSLLLFLPAAVLALRRMHASIRRNRGIE